MRYKLREMTVADIDAIMAGEKRAFGDTLGYDLLYSDLTLNPFAHYMVLEINKKVHGYIGLWIDDHAEICNFYVDQEYQNMHFGSMMLEFAFELCKLSKIANISLEVRPSNEKALYLYQKYGFKVDHVRDNYYSNGEKALVLLKEFGDEK